MTKQTFQIAKDSDGTAYIYQAIDEMDKNHSAKDTDFTNQGWIYEVKGKLKI